MIVVRTLKNRVKRSVRCLSTSPKIPLIDFGRFHKNNSHDREILAKEIDEACTEIGFFAIVNHGVDDIVISDAWAKTQEFFDLPAEKKLEASPSMTSDYPYGYIPLGGEKLAAGRDAEVGREDKATPPDLNESFSVGPERTNSNNAPMRQWPIHDPAFIDAWTNYYASLETLSASLLETFAIALKLPSSKWFENKIDHHRCALRALHYPHPKGEIPPGQLRASAHTDYGSLTILLQDNAPGGLQVKASDERSGGWTPVPREEGAFVINLGDLMARWTNDKWTSTLHRVVMPPPDAQGSTRRQSMAFFHNINPDHIVECIETCQSPENPPKYEPIRAFDFLMKKHAAATGGS